MKWNFLYQITAASRTLTRELPPPDPRSVCPLSSTEFVEPLPKKKYWIEHVLKRDGTRAETRFVLSEKRSIPFKLAGGGGQFRRLFAAEVCASAVVMLDTPCSEAECKTTGYPLHSHVSPSLPLSCVTVCHQVSTELYATSTNVTPLRAVVSPCSCYVVRQPSGVAVGIT